MTLYLWLIGLLEGEGEGDLPDHTLSYVFGYAGIRGGLGRKARRQVYRLLNANYGG